MSNKPVPFPYRPSSSLHFADMRPTFLSMFKNVFLPQRLDAFRDVVQRMPAGLERMPAGLERTHRGTLAVGCVYQRLSEISYGAQTLSKIDARVTWP